MIRVTCWMIVVLEGPGIGLVTDSKVGGDDDEAAG
jgi:hypothetical protein